MFRNIVRFAAACAVVAILALWTSSATADEVVFSNFGPGDTWKDSGFFGINPGTGFALGFTSSGSGQFSKAEAVLKSLDPSTAAQATLWLTDSLSAPTFREELNFEVAPGDFSIHTVHSIQMPLLQAGASYWLAIINNSASAFIGWAPPPTPDFGHTAVSLDGGESWIELGESASRGTFRVSVAPEMVPEPSSVVLLVAGGAGCRLARLRRRQKRILPN